MKKPTVYPPLIVGTILLFDIIMRTFFGQSVDYGAPNDIYFLKLLWFVFPLAPLCVLSILVYSAKITKTKSSIISIGIAIAATLLSVLRATIFFLKCIYEKYYYSLLLDIVNFWDFACGDLISCLIACISFIIAIGFFIDNHKQNTLVVVSSIAYMICLFLEFAVKLCVDFTDIDVSYWELFRWINIIENIIVPCWIFSACTIKQVSKTK